MLVVAVVARQGGGSVPRRRRSASRRRACQRELLFLAVGAALAGAGANALGTYLVASAVDVGIAEGTAGLLAALGSAASLAVRMSLGARADRRRDYGYGTVVALLVAGVGRASCS